MSPWKLLWIPLMLHYIINLNLLHFSGEMIDVHFAEWPIDFTPIDPECNHPYFGWHHVDAAQCFDGDKTSPSFAFNLPAFLFSAWLVWLDFILIKSPREPQRIFNYQPYASTRTSTYLQQSAVTLAATMHRIVSKIINTTFFEWCERIVYNLLCSLRQCIDFRCLTSHWLSLSGSSDSFLGIRVIFGLRNCCFNGSRWCLLPSRATSAVPPPSFLRHPFQMELGSRYKWLNVGPFCQQLRHL